MKYNCADEFDLDLIYRKLTSGHKPVMVKAKNFFDHNNELEMLQKKMNRMMYQRMQNYKKRFTR